MAPGTRFDRVPKSESGGTETLISRHVGRLEARTNGKKGTPEGFPQILKNLGNTIT